MRPVSRRQFIKTAAAGGTAMAFPEILAGGPGAGPVPGTSVHPQELVNLAGDPACSGIVKDLCARLDKHAEGAVEIAREYLVR